jgi:hypothetical protein
MQKAKDQKEEVRVSSAFVSISAFLSVSVAL